MVTLVNLTPHPITLHLNSGESKTIEPSGIICRAFESKSFEGKLDVEGGSLSLWHISYGEPIGLPEPKPDTMYIVSHAAAASIRQHCPERVDVVVVTDLVRDHTGQVNGALGLAKLS